MTNYRTYSFDELFLPIEKGTSKFTEYAIYRSLESEGDLVPLWGGNHEHDSVNQFVSVNAKNKDNEQIKIFEGECIIISLDGSAGSMTYKAKGEKFALNHHAGVLRCKDRSKLNLQYFKYRYENALKGLAISDGSKTLSKRQLEKEFFELPDLEEQEVILSRYLKLASMKKEIKECLAKIDQLQSKKLESISSEEETLIALTTLFDLNQGHQITDYELYYTEGDIPVYTGNNELKGHWNKSIVKNEDLPCLSYPSKGNAGIVFVHDVIFDANNTAILIPKKEWREKISLDWFRFKLPFLFLEIMTSKGGVSYLNREIVEKIQIPLIKKISQENEAVVLKKFENLKNKLEILFERIDVNLNREVFVDNIKHLV
ncbi:restriction endonuclease subunit S [Candidatus Peregrinibacteria bacterium]|nr:restriction endonuclease subunit S [Candidatus Peregrinibacteria bacterium]